jgi:hypothetical protein
MKIIAFGISVIGIIIVRIGIRKRIWIPVRIGIAIGVIITVAGIGGAGGDETYEKEKENITRAHSFSLTAPAKIIVRYAAASPLAFLEYYNNFNALEKICKAWAWPVFMGQDALTAKNSSQIDYFLT